MISISAIVEGDGEIEAFPVLLRRLLRWRKPDVQINVLRPIRVRRDSFLKKDKEFSRYLRMASDKCGESGLVLVLLDADDDCPKKLGAEIRERAFKVAPEAKVSVVLPNREYEAWFIAAAQSLTGCRGFVFDGAAVVDPEVPRNAKGWIKERTVNKRYDPVIDQPAFSAAIDLEMAYAQSRSFRKLCGDLDRF